MNTKHITDKIRTYAKTIIITGVIAAEALTIGLQEYQNSKMQQEYQISLNTQKQHVEKLTDIVLKNLDSLQNAEVTHLDQLWKIYKTKDSAVQKWEENQYNWKTMQWNKQLLNNPQYQRLIKEQTNAHNNYYQTCDKYSQIYTARENAKEIKRLMK